MPRPLLSMPGLPGMAIFSPSVRREDLPAASQLNPSKIMFRAGHVTENGSTFHPTGRGHGRFGKYRLEMAAPCKLPRLVASPHRKTSMENGCTCGRSQVRFGRCRSGAGSLCVFYKAWKMLLFGNLQLTAFILSTCQLRPP